VRPLQCRQVGNEAQCAAVASYLAGFGAAPLTEFVEVESGKRNDRPELARALTECRVQKATLGIAKLDRLARDAHFLLGLLALDYNYERPNDRLVYCKIMVWHAQGQKHRCLRHRNRFPRAGTRGIR
jgi:Resolvase, N terminal domain